MGEAPPGAPLEPPLMAPRGPPEVRDSLKAPIAIGKVPPLRTPLRGALREDDHP